MNIIFIFFAFIAFLISFVVNWILVKFSVNLGVRNISKEEEIRWQGKKPSVGGITFFISFLILYSVLSILYKDAVPFDNNIELSLIVICTLAFIIGLIDDAKNTNPLLKLIGQIICGSVLAYFGFTIEVSPNLVWNQLLTVIWVVFLMNSINMLDNMDGLATLISILIISAIAISSQLITEIYFIHIICFVGALFGFLYYNWKPSRIYMGDSGSQLLGAFLAHTSVICLWNHRAIDGGYFQLAQFFLPFFIFTIPIFDTSTVFIHRLLRRQSPFIGGKDHLSHHFVYLGLSDDIAVLTLGIINLFFIFLGLWIYFQAKNLILFGFIGWFVAFIVIQVLYIRGKHKNLHSIKDNISN